MRRLVYWIVVVALSVSASTASGAQVAVVVGPDAPELDRFAAAELCGYLQKLFAIETKPTTSIPPGVDHAFLIGNPTTNPLIAKTNFPNTTDQGVTLKTTGPTTLVGGGSPVATLWAVYALAEHWGVRFLLHGDVLPERAMFKMPELDVTEEPNLRIRQWRVLNEHAMGPISWGIADCKPIIAQLAKLRFNRLLLYIWPGQPFLPLEYKGIRQTSGTLFFGNRYPITDDMVGRSLFGAEKEFWNPDLPLPGGDPAELTRAAVEHVQSLISYAKSRGMTCVMPATLTEFPREFKPLLQHTNPIDMIGTPTIGPGANADVDDPVLAGLARAVLKTTIKTYPDVEYIALDMPEWREWTNHYERAWIALDAKYAIGKVRSLADALAMAERRRDYPGGPERAVKEVKADIVALYFYDKLISDPASKFPAKKFILSTVAEELFPILPRILPAGSETMNFVDYTPSRVVKRREVLKDIPARQIPSTLIFTLHDDNVGVLPQLATHSLNELMRDIRLQGWAGFSTRYWLIGDHDPCVAFLSRAAWDAKVTPTEIYRDQIAHVCGEAAVEDMLTVFREVEMATETLEWHGLGFTFTTPVMMMQHWQPGELSATLASVIPHYQAGIAAAERAAQVCQPSGRRYIEYWIGRLKFGVAYMNAVKCVRRAATAEAAGDSAGGLLQTNAAIQKTEEALTAYASVARDRSDKGAIAVMNEYVVRPLRAKRTALEKAMTSP